MNRYVRYCLNALLFVAIFVGFEIAQVAQEEMDLILTADDPIEVFESYSNWMFQNANYFENQLDEETYDNLILKIEMAFSLDSLRKDYRNYLSENFSKEYINPLTEWVSSSVFRKSKNRSQFLGTNEGRQRLEQFRQKLKSKEEFTPREKQIRLLVECDSLTNKRLVELHSTLIRISFNIFNSFLEPNSRFSQEEIDRIMAEERALILEGMSYDNLAIELFMTKDFDGMELEYYLEFPKSDLKIWYSKIQYRAYRQILVMAEGRALKN